MIRAGLGRTVDSYAGTLPPYSPGKAYPELASLLGEAVVYQDGVIVERHSFPGYPKGYRAVDLGDKSFFHGSGIDPQRMRGADYDPGPTATHHSDGRNEYLLTETVLSADLVVNLVAVALMGFDETRLPKLFEAMNDEGLRDTAVRSIDDVEIGEVDAETFTAKPRSIDSLRSANSFVAHPGWQGHVN